MPRFAFLVPVLLLAFSQATNAQSSYRTILEDQLDAVQDRMSTEGYRPDSKDMIVGLLDAGAAVGLEIDLVGGVEYMISTGNPAIDELIRAETTKIKGFPLKQTIRITMTDLTASKRTSSELKLPATRTRTRELTVTSIRETTPQDSWFAVPANYKRVDFVERANKSQTQVLSMEPASE